MRVNGAAAIERALHGSGRKRGRMGHPRSNVRCDERAVISAKRPQTISPFGGVGADSAYRASAAIAGRTFASSSRHELKRARSSGLGTAETRAPNLCGCPTTARERDDHAGT
jgi:hypothetical protein